MDTRQADRPRRDADELLLNGFWKSKRVQSTASAPARPVTPVSSEPTKAPKPQRRVRKEWPPPPVVEDEVVSLAKEHLGADVRNSQIKSNEPPFRGTVDQCPVILESDISPGDAAKLHTKIQAETKADDSGERRFVLVPRDDTYSPVRNDDEAPRKSYTDPKMSTSTQLNTDRRSPRPYESSAPPLERRRSRQDLPTLQTGMPQYRRSTSAYAYTPTSKQGVKSPVTGTGELLSPDAATGRGQSKSYFDLPNKTSPRQSQVNAGATVVEKRRSAGPPSRPTTPTTPVGEKRNSTGSDAYGRPRQDLPEKLTRPQQLSTESGVRRSERAPSAHAHLEPSENSRHRKSSSQTSRRYYGSSDDDQESSDSDRRRTNHRHHHHRQHMHGSLRPDDDPGRHHHRSGSKSTNRSSDGKAGSRISSPLASPNISPSQIPPTDKNDAIRFTNPAASRDSRRPNSRPVSPLSGYADPPRPGATLEPSNNHGRSRHSGSRSRNSSPVAAPGARSSINTSSATLPIPIPTRIDLHSPGNTRGSPSIPQYDDRRSSSARPPSAKPSWQPPPLQPPSEPAYLERPVGSYRRYSQDIDDGTIAPLPPCPRTTLTRGHNDWLTLPRAPAFNICPSCFESTMAPTEFQSHFILAPQRTPHEEVICDFGSQPWYRIAWLLTRKERRHDLALLTSLAKIASSIPPCLGKHEAVRKWYSILDPTTHHPIRNFDVCFACVRSIETLLPSMQDLFVRTDHTGPPGLPRVCDMRFDSARFVHYFDALETAADDAAAEDDPRYAAAPNMADFAALARRFAALPECPRDRPVANAHWYLITQLPELTVCPECFQDVVVPGLDLGRAIPSMFQKAPVRVAGSTSCQLYSERMRGVFGRAVQASDYKMLAVRARERWAKEVELREAGKRKGGEKEVRRLEAEWKEVE